MSKTHQIDAGAYLAKVAELPGVLQHPGLESHASALHDDFWPEHRDEINAAHVAHAPEDHLQTMARHPWPEIASVGGGEEVFTRAA